MSDEYQDLWPHLLDKRYQGAPEFLRGIHPIKNPARSTLSQTDIRFNANVSGGPIIVETLFGDFA